MSINKKISTWEDFGIFVWKKHINLLVLRSSFIMAVTWDCDWDYGYKRYCENYTNLTQDEYMQIIEFIKENTSLKEKVKEIGQND